MHQVPDKAAKLSDRAAKRSGSAAKLRTELNIFQERRSLHSVTHCLGAVFRLLGVIHCSEYDRVRKSPGMEKLFLGRLFKIRSMKSVQMHGRY